jgi:hypothetical protein
VTVVKPFQAKPSVVSTVVVGEVEHATIDARLIETLTYLIPLASLILSSFLEVKTENVVVEIVCYKEPVECTHRQCGNLVWNHHCLDLDR